MKYRGILTVSACLLATTIVRAGLPSTITTTDGQVYKGVSLIRAEPDGYLVNYQPVSNGVGIAKIKFSRLTKEMQRRADYSPGEAREFELAISDAEQEYAKTISQWNAEAAKVRAAQTQWQQESAARVKAQMADTFRAAAAPAPSSVTSYSVPSWGYGGGGLFLVPVPQMGTAGKIDNTRAKIFTSQDKMLPRKAGKYSY